METKNASRVSWKHIVLSILILIIFVLTMGVHVNAEGKSSESVAKASVEVIPLRLNRILLSNAKIGNQNEVKLAGPKEEVRISFIDAYITKYDSELKFLSKTFSVDYNDIVLDLHRIHIDNDEFNETNVGNIGEDGTYDTALYGMVEYFFDFQKRNPNKINKKRNPYKSDAKYIEDLITFYTKQIYTNVPTSLALSIGAAESGYYKARHMLNANNIYGGMSSNGLIKYRNIEYGVLSYIRLLSKGYINRGLKTVEAIGKVYCPTYDEYGNKIASSHWIKLVKTAMKKYDDYNLGVSIDDLLKDE